MPASAAGRAGVDRADQRAGRRGALAGGEAEVRAVDVAVLDQLRDDVADAVDRDGEADAGVAAAGGGDLRVDADHAAGGVEQRAARVAGVDGGVGLHGAGDREAVGRLDLAVERGDDAGRDGAREAERAADGDRGLTRAPATSRRRAGAA